MDFKKIINLTGKKIVDIVIFGVVISGLFVGILYSMGLLKFTFDTNDLIYLVVALAAGFGISFFLNKKFGQAGGSPAAPGAAPAQPQPAAPPAQPPAQPPAPAQ